MLRTKYSALALFILAASAATAHHSFPAVYDPAQLVTIEGSVIRLDLTNPHAYIYLAVTDEENVTTEWAIEMPGKLALVRRGWTDDTLVPGEMLVAEGHPSLAGDPAMWWQRINLADGREYLFPALADQLAVEAARRERIRQLDQ